MIAVDPPDAWRIETEQHIECFLNSLPAAIRSEFDFSWVSMDAWERWISTRNEVLQSGSNDSTRNVPPAAHLYLGETVRRNLGGEWKLLVAGEVVRDVEGQWQASARMPIHLQGAEPCIDFGDKRPSLTPRHWIALSSKRNEPGLLRWTLDHFEPRCCSEHCLMGLWRTLDPQHPERGVPLRFDFDVLGNPIGAVLEIEGTPVRISRARSTLGRSKEADVVLDKSLVADISLISRIAAVLQMCPHGVMLLDHCSGTSVRVHGFQAPAQLFQFDVIHLGTAKLRLRREQQPDIGGT